MYNALIELFNELNKVNNDIANIDAIADQKASEIFNDAWRENMHSTIDNIINDFMKDYTK